MGLTCGSHSGQEGGKGYMVTCGGTDCLVLTVTCHYDALVLKSACVPWPGSAVAGNGV